jgi:septum site-determining protein MinD
VGRVIVVTSGKGGVGKTTTSASISVGLALKGYTVAVIDFDVGLRNLDLMMGCEKNIVHDFLNVAKNQASITQALIADKWVKNLYILASSQTGNKDDLTTQGVSKVIDALKKAGFDFIICDSPAGIEKGAKLALHYADEAIVITNPEITSVRDADRILGVIQDTSKRSKENKSPVLEHLVLTRYQPTKVKNGEMLAVDKIVTMLDIPLLGVVPEAEQVLSAINSGRPVILDKGTDVSEAYKDIVARLLGEDCQQRFLTEPKKGFFSRIFK